MRKLAVIFGLTNAATVSTCVSQSSDSVGPALGTFQTDLSILQANESPSYSWRLQTLIACVNSQSQLTGVRAVANKFSNGASVGMQTLSAFGAAYGSTTAGITCTTLPLDYANGEIVTSLVINYDANAVRNFQAITSKNNTLSRGKILST